MLFGSDFPLITPDRWLADFEQINIRPEVRPLILKENAVMNPTHKCGACS
jgi:predicted TIM-barrel fold metal-dependent hydrolase